jgi:hypothetical protein
MAHYVIADPAEQRAAISKLDGVLDSEERHLSSIFLARKTTVSN